MPGLAGEWVDAKRRGLGLGQWRNAQRACLDLLPSLGIIRNGLILDVGANIGDWTAAVLATEPSVAVIAVEPGDDPRAILERRFADDKRVTINPCAVGDVAGSREFYVTEHSHNASLQRPRVEMDSLYPGRGWRTTSIVNVDVTTVDDICDGRDVALLKIDVQGAEREVLAGASDTLTRTSSVLLEVTFISHYQGDTTFPFLHEYMIERGFELAGLSQPFLSQRRTALWCDACYTQRPQG